MAKSKEELEHLVEQLKTHLKQKDLEVQAIRNELIILNSQLENLMGKIQTQLNLAGKIQEVLLPTEIPTIPGFEFSNKFIASGVSGGDYFDIFEIEDKFRFGLLLASSSGHGISALFLSILLKLTGKIEAKKGASPDKVIQMISKEIIPKIDDADYANLFYGIVDRRNFELKYCSVGSNSIFHYKFSEKEVYKINKDNPPLKKGLKEHPPLETIELNPRDCLVGITEGLVNAINENGEKFGEKRVMEIIFNKVSGSPHDIRNEIFYQVKKFMGDSALKKDITVLVAEVKDRVLKLAK